MVKPNSSYVGAKLCIGDNSQKSKPATKLVVKALKPHLSEIVSL